MENTRNFNCLIGHAIKHDVRIRENRTQLGRKLVPRTPHERMLLKPLRGAIQVEKNTVSNLRRAHTLEIMPNIEQILLGARCPDNAPTVGHARRELAE